MKYKYICKYFCRIKNHYWAQNHQKSNLKIWIPNSLACWLACDLSMYEVIPPVDTIEEKECQGEKKAATLINSSRIPTLPPEIFVKKHL